MAGPHVKCFAIVAIGINIALLCALLGVTVHLTFSDTIGPDEKIITDTTKDILSSQASTDLQAVELKREYNGSQKKPVLFTGVDTQNMPHGEMLTVLRLLDDPEVPTFLLQDLQLKDGRIEISNTSNYFLLITVLYDNQSQSSIRVMLECFRTTRVKTLESTSRLCSKGHFCSVSLFGIYQLSQGDTVYCEVNHGELMVCNIQNTHFTLFMI